MTHKNTICNKNNNILFNDNNRNNNKSNIINRYNKILQYLIIITFV